MSSVPAVHLEGGVLGESGPAVVALVGLRPRVRPLVQQQGGLGAQRLPAVGADVAHGVAFVYLRRSLVGGACSLDVTRFKLSSLQISFRYRKLHQRSPVFDGGQRPSFA